jgi:caa(3)-type oxidase subunit IV
MSSSKDDMVASYDHGHPHSHKKHYYRVGAALVAITAVELGILWVPQIKPLWVPLMFVLAIVKFAVVVGEFMHLREDKPVYKVVFIAPLILALISFCVLGLLAMIHYGPFGQGYAYTAVDVRAGYIPPSAGQMAEPAPSEEKLVAVYKEAEASKFAQGAKIFVEKCASCHGDHGQGLANLGPNMTDNCYLHGGKLADLYTTVRNGVSTASPAMPAWGTQLNATQIKHVASYIRSLRGTNVAGGKACQGTPVND